MSRPRRLSVDLSAGISIPSRRSSVDLTAGVGIPSRRQSVDYGSGLSSSLGGSYIPSGTASYNPVDLASIRSPGAAPAYDFSSGPLSPSGAYARGDFGGGAGFSNNRRYGSSYDMGTSRGYGGGTGTSKYGGSSGYGGSGSSYLNSSYGAPRSSYRQSSYEPRLSSYTAGGSVMDRVKQFNPETRSAGSYTPLNSRRASQRDYGGGSAGGNSWDKYSRSGGSDYSASNRSGYLSDYGGSTPSLYGSWDRTSSRGRYGGASRETSPVSSRAPVTRARYGGASRETSPVTSRPPATRQYDYSSSASPSPYSTYRRGSDANRSPSVLNRYERQSSRPEMEESPSRPRRKWESEVYGVAKNRPTSRETLPEPVKPPPKDYSSSESDDSAPEDDKSRGRYLMSRGTSPMPEPGKRDRRSKDMSSVISKVKRVKCPKDSRQRNRFDFRRKRQVDCATQTNLDESQSRRSRQGGPEKRATRDEIAKMAALALLNEDSGDAGEGFYKSREKFQQAASPLTTPANKKRSGNFDVSPGRTGEELSGWRKAVYDDTPSTKQRNSSLSNRDSSFGDSLDVPDEKSWRKAVYGEPEAPPPGQLGRLKHYQTEEDLRVAVDGSRSHRAPKTSTPAHLMQDGDSTESPDQDPRMYNRRSGQSDKDKRRSQNESEKSQKRRSSSRDSILDDKPNRRRRQRTSSREILDDSEPSQTSGRTTLTPDSLSLRDSIEKVKHWKQNLPPGIQDNRLTVDIPRSDSGEYFSAQSHDSASRYKDKVRAQQSPLSPQTDPFSEEDVLSPGGNSRRRRGRRHLSRELSTEEYEDEKTHHPVNKERIRKSELNRNPDKERKELEDLERRRRIYSGEDPVEVEESLRKRRSDTSSDAFFRDESPNRRRSQRTSRHNSREDVLDDRRPRKDKRSSDAQASDGSQFGFNREGSPNRPSSRAKRRSRHSSQEGILDEEDRRYSQYVRSNESLAQLSAAGSIPSLHSARTDDGTIQNAASMQSLESNEIQEIPSSGGSLPDIIPGEGSKDRLSKTQKKPQSQKHKSSGLISGTRDIDNLLNLSANEEEIIERGRGLRELATKQNSHILDQPVPREPSPLRPQNSEENLIDLDEPTHVSPLAADAASPSPRKAKREELSPTGKEMWDLLKHRKGLVVIGDILDLCAKPVKPRYIRVPGREEEDKSFRGYETASEMLENMLVDTKQLDDCALQIYRYHNGTQGDYNTYLDLESTIDEQSEDLEGFQDQRKNALILRTQLTVRVHAVIEKLLNSSGRELRRALFSLKQIFQDDKDLVHEFVNNDGLDCLIKVGAEADQNYQNYILRALGQVMLYVDGMNGVINHNATIQWLYSLLASKTESISSRVTDRQFSMLLDLHSYAVTKFRLVVKTALKLLLVFVEYTETNATHLVKAVLAVDKKRMVKPWTNIMSILDEKDGGDSELLVYAMTLLNKVLSALPDQDTFYDVTDALEELGMERITQRHMKRKGADLDLLTQFQMYEAALKSEDGDDDDLGQLENLRRTPRIKSEGDSVRKSRRFSTGVMPPRDSLGMNKQNSAPSLNNNQQPKKNPAEEYNQRRSRLKEQGAYLPEEHEQVDRMPDPGWRKSRFIQPGQPISDENENVKYIGINGSEKSVTPPPESSTEAQPIGDTPRSRRDRRARQRDFYKSQEQGGIIPEAPGDRMSIASTSSTSTCSSQSSVPPAPAPQEPAGGDVKQYSSLSSLSDAESLDNQQFKMGREPPDKMAVGRAHEESGYQSTGDMSYNNESQEINGDASLHGMSNNQRWKLYKMQHKDDDTEPVNGSQDIRNEQTFKDSANAQIGDSNKVDNKSDVKSKLELLTGGQMAEDGGPKKPTGPAGDKSGLISQRLESLNKSNKEPAKPEPSAHPKPEIKQTESDVQWEKLQKRFHRSLKIHDMDFTDLKDSEDEDVFAPPKIDFGGGVPPPPPPLGGMPPPPPPMGGIGMPPPPPPMMGVPPPPPPLGLTATPTIAVDLPPPPGGDLQKTKKTVKLHWKTVQPEAPHPSTKGETIWKNVLKVAVDVDKLEHLFETRQAELKQKRVEATGKKMITVLDTKRSNAINIGLTVLPPPRTIKTAILKMDNSIMNKEGIEKILTTMIPSEEEKNKILEAQLANPDIPLGTAEQFLLTLSSISELQARLNVWLFKLDYESIESEIAEPLMDLKKGIEELHVNKTFKYILSAILTVGNFLNGSQVRGFSIEYLSKVPEVKDTVHKHSILHHLCTLILEQFPDSTDLYSEIGPVTRCSRVEWDELKRKLDKLEYDCKASWDNLRAIKKHDGSSNSQLNYKPSESQGQLQSAMACFYKDVKSAAWMSEFITDAAERIMILQIVHRRVCNRYNKLLLYMGLQIHQARDLKVNHFCKVVSEFALEYRTTREKVVQQLEKKANQRERKKTRGKMIVDMGKFKGSKGSSSKDDVNDDALQKVLSNGYTSENDRGLPGRAGRRRMGPMDTKRASMSSSRGCVTTDSEMYDTGDDELLEACVRTATTPSTRAPRERKRSKQTRKSLRRTLKNGLSADELNAVAASECV